MEQLSLVNYECPMLFDEWCNPKSKMEHDATQVPEYASKSILHRRCNAMDHEMPLSNPRELCRHVTKCGSKCQLIGFKQNLPIWLPANLPVVFQHSVWWLSQAMGIHHLQHPFHASSKWPHHGNRRNVFQLHVHRCVKNSSTVYNILHTRLIKDSTVETLPSTASTFPSQPYHRYIVKDKHIYWIHTAW